MNRYSPDSVEHWRALLADVTRNGDIGGKWDNCPPRCRQLIISALHNYTFIARETMVDIISHLMSLPGPEQSLARFERFCTVAEGSINIATSADAFARVIATVFASSGALSVRLAAAPEVASAIAAMDAPFEPALEVERYHNRIAALVPATASISDRIRTVHIAHTAELVRICARNGNPSVPIAEITAELSALAEAVIDTCLDIAVAELSGNTGETTPHGLFVLGLGKFGGCELNVSSDVDLIYLSDRMEGWDSFEDMTLHTRLAERLTQLLTEATALGYLYRVDTRLRADGASGPLVRTTADYLRYLEMRGLAWERQMLLKARPVAGSYEGGRRFLEAVEHFIYPTSITRSPNREIVALKNQIESRLEATGSKKTHLKLMPGGIRDIEFITQCLQLLMGGMHRDVRVTGTLPALDMLHRTNALTDSEYQTLAGAYVLYRRIENALMWPELLPAFHIPETGEGFARLEQTLGESGLRDMITHNLDAVRSIYNDIFSSDGEESFEDMSIRAALNPVGDDRVRRFLESLGFADPEAGSRDLTRLVFGETDSAQELAMHPATEAFLPKYLRALSELPDPGGTLAHFRLIADAYNARSALFDIMNRNDSFFSLILSITHASAFMTGMLVKDPSLLDWLVESGELVHRIDRAAIARSLDRIDHETPDDVEYARQCLRLKHQQKLRIGARDITGIAEPGETFLELTTLAELVTEAVCHRARRLQKAGHPASAFEFAVLAAGKLGSGQMDFGSDLDLIFVYRPPAGTGQALHTPQQAVALAQHILTMLGGGGVYRVYEVDARLRPEGGNAPLAVSLSEYKRYFERRASTWERLALVRARTVCGDREFASDVEDTVHRYVYGEQFSADEIRSVMAMRETMIQAAAGRTPGQTDIKSGRGGITDITFIAQTYACQFGHDNPAIRHTRTTEILKGLGEAGILTRSDVSALTELFGFLMSVEKAARIGSGKAVSTLPDSGYELARIGRLLGFTNVRRFSRRLTDVTTLAGESYDRLMNGLLSSVDASSSKTEAPPPDSE